jgi:mannosyltransferase
MSLSPASERTGADWTLQRLADRLGLASGELALLAACTALAALLRFATLGLQSYWFDEAVTVDLLRRSFGGMLRALPDSESTPPLYYVVAWLWAKVFGTSEIGLRALSALLGTATVPAAYAAANALTTRRTALLTSVFVAVSPMLIWYSQEARAYALLAFLATVALFFFARILRTGETRDVCWWGVAAGLSLTTHYFAIFFVAPEAIWLLLRLRGRRDAVLVVAAVAAVTAALLPLASHQERGGRTGWIRESSLGTRVRETAAQFLSSFYPLAHAALIALAVGVLVLIGLWLWVRGADRRGGLIALAIAAATVLLPVLVAAISHRSGARGDYFYFRNVIAGWVPLAIALAAVIAGAKRGFVVLLAGGACAALLLVPTLRIDLRPNLQRDDWRGVADALGPPQPGRIIALRAGFLEPALRLYRPDVAPLPAGGGRAKDILLVTSAATTTLHGFRRPSGFVRVDRRVVQHFSIVDLRASSARLVTSRALFPSRDGGVFVERSSSAPPSASP